MGTFTNLALLGLAGAGGYAVLKAKREKDALRSLKTVSSSKAGRRIGAASKAAHEWKESRGADIDGTSLQGSVPKLTVSRVRAAFGSPVHEGDDDYGPEWNFKREDGAVASLYTRGSRFNIGARDKATAQSFRRWLKRRLGK